MKVLTRTVAWRRWAVLLAQAAITCGLSAARLDGQYAPWALAAVALGGSGIHGAAALLGAGIGGWLFFPFQAGLRHIAAATLVYSAAVCFSGSRVCRRPWFRPASCAVMPLAVHFPALIGRGFTAWALCLAAGAVAALCVRLAEDRERLPWLLVWGFAVAMAPLTVDGLSPGRMAGAWLTLLLATLWCAEESAAAGLAVGATLGLTGGRPELVTAVALGIGGWAAAMGMRRSRRWAAGLFFLAAGLTPPLFDADNWDITLFETAVAAIAYLCIPGRMLAMAPREDGQRLSPAPEQNRRLGAAFRALYESFLPQPETEESPSVVFDRAAETVCRECERRQWCWQQHREDTCAAFSAACPSLLRRGRGLAEDFPAAFVEQCVHFPALLQAIDREAYGFLLRRQYRVRMGAVRDLAAEQYARMEEVLLSEAVPAHAEAGGNCHTDMALRPKEGQTLCGDQAEILTVGGTVYLLLCDGMGSGEAAHAESALAVRLLRQFLTAGIAPLPALKTLGSAMRLRFQESGSFTTVDLLAVQDATGQATLYKYGAAASYVKRGGSVKRIAAAGLPAALAEPREDPEITALTLGEGSVAVMVSDGVIAQGDEWLQNLLAGWDGGPVHRLTARILAEADRHGGREDDCAVLVVERKKSGAGRVRRV